VASWPTTRTPATCTASPRRRSQAGIRCRLGRPGGVPQEGRHRPSGHRHIPRRWRAPAAAPWSAQGNHELARRSAAAQQAGEARAGAMAEAGLVSTYDVEAEARKHARGRAHPHVVTGQASTPVAARLPRTTGGHHNAQHASGPHVRWVSLSTHRGRRAWAPDTGMAPPTSTGNHNARFHTQGGPPPSQRPPRRCWPA
jgi:hypothetical protein